MQLEAQRTILPNTELTIRYNDYMMVGVLIIKQAKKAQKSRTQINTHIQLKLVIWRFC